MTIPFFHQFFKFKKPLKRIATLTSRKAIENSPYNKKLLDQQNLTQAESRNLNQEESKEESSETKFNFFYLERGGGNINIKDRKNK